MILSHAKRINVFLSRFTRRYHRGTVLLLTLLLIIINYSYWNGSRDNQFPKCPSDVHKQKVLQLSARRINVFSSSYYSGKTNSSDKNHGFNHYNSEKLLLKSECVDMSMMKDSRVGLLKICIYDPSKDMVVSRQLKTHGFWEKENVLEMMKALEMYPRMILVDLGSNVGTFSLQAASRGAEVIAVDALLSNHFLLHRSLIYNDLSCNVTLLHNAIHSHQGEMRITVNPSNIGGSIVSEIPDFRKENIPHSQKVDAICLDDLVPLVLGKDVFLKMDLEGSEKGVLNCAHAFFTRANVKVVLIEWMNYRHNERDSESIKRFLTSHQMVPTWGVDPDRTIDVQASHAWPDNVFWIKT